MKKISTLYKKNPENLGRVINEVDPNNAWVFESGIPTRKFDGTACAIFDGILYRRYDIKAKRVDSKGNYIFDRPIPEGAIPCQEPDTITGHFPHWVPVDLDDRQDWIITEAYNNLEDKQDGTYECCGPKVNKNRERFGEHTLIKHGSIVLDDITDFSFESLMSYFQNKDIEGIVFHDKNPTGNMCKIRLSDFGIKRGK